MYSIERARTPNNLPTPLTSFIGRADENRHAQTTCPHHTPADAHWRGRLRQDETHARIGE